MPPENVLGSKHMANADFAPIVKRNKRTYLYSLLIVHIKLCLCGLVSNVLGFLLNQGQEVHLQRQRQRHRQSGWKGAPTIFFRFLQQVVANLKSGRKIYLTLLFVLNDPLPCIWSFSSRKQILFRMHISAVRGNPSSSAAESSGFMQRNPLLPTSIFVTPPPDLSRRVVLKYFLCPWHFPQERAILLSANKKQKVKYRYLLLLTHSY